MQAPAIAPAPTWVPLQDAWRETAGGDPKFHGLALAALFRLGVPVGALVLGRADWDAGEAERAAAEAAAWIESAEGRPVGAAGPDGTPLLLTVRFGDKHADPRKPPSVSLIGAATPRTAAEAEAHLRAFLDRIGALDRYDALAALPPAARAARVAALGFARLAELGVDRPQVLLQRAAVTVEAPESGHGTAYTRHPQTAEEMDYGRYMWDATGHEFDARAGDPRKRDLSALAEEHPGAYARLRAVLAFVEAYFQEIRFVEFGLERGRLRIFQVTPRKRAEGTVPPMRRLPPAAAGNEDDPPPAPPPAAWEELRMEGLAVRVAAGAAAEAVEAVALAADPPGAPAVESWTLTLRAGAWPSSPPPGGVPRVMERSLHGVHLVAWSLARADGEWIVEPRWGSALRVEPGARRLGVLGPARPAADLAAHAVEALWREYLETHGWACLHAASVEAAGRAWLLVGEKGAGKTTLQLALLREGARLLSADRTWVAAEPAGPAARRGPGALRLTGHTLALVPGVVETDGAPSFGSRKHTLPLARFAAAGLLSGSARLPLGGYLFVQRGQGEGGWRVRPAPAAAAAAHLLAGPDDPQRRWLHAWRWWGAGTPPALPAAPAWSLEGSGAPADAARRVLDLLAGEG